MRKRTEVGQVKRLISSTLERSLLSLIHTTCGINHSLYVCSLKEIEFNRSYASARVSKELLASVEVLSGGSDNYLVTMYTRSLSTVAF